MNSIELKNNLKKGELVLGTLIVSASPFWLKILENCSLDFIFIDTEHIALNRVDLSWMCRSYSAIGYPPLVRMPSPDPYIATQYLDDGASGVIAPYVEKIEQVRELIGATKKRPIKGKKLEESFGMKTLYSLKESSCSILIFVIPSGKDDLEH
mgnify:CR=1 FL=1